MSLPDADRYVWADLSAEGAPGAGLLSFEGCKKISLAVNLLSDPDQLLRTGDRTETAPLASLSVDFNLGHRFSLQST